MGRDTALPAPSGESIMNALKSAKRFIFIIFSVSLLLPIFSADFFSDTASGGAVDFLPSAASGTPEVQFRGFYRTQVQIGERFLANTAVSLKTGNLFGDIKLRDISSLFNIDELSLMYRFKIEKTASQFALFAGEYEAAGSDTFTQRYLGTKSFASYLLEKETGFKTPAIVPVGGAGGSFTIKYAVPVANALYLYYNEQFGKNRLNTDIRIAGVSNALIADFMFGTSLPFENKDANGKDVILIIRRADFHAGFSLLLGDNPFVNLFMQAGVTRIQTNPDPGDSIFSISDLYAFFEPRFSTRAVLFSLSAFHLPLSVYENIPYIDYPLGAAFMIKSIPISFKSAQGVFGCIFAVSTVNPLVSAFSMQKLSAQVVPFVEFTAPQGVFKVKVPVKPLAYADWKKMFSITASYKVQL